MDLFSIHFIRRFIILLHVHCIFRKIFSKFSNTLNQSWYKHSQLYCINFLSCGDIYLRRQWFYFYSALSNSPSIWRARATRCTAASSSPQNERRRGKATRARAREYHTRKEDNGERLLSGGTKALIFLHALYITQLLSPALRANGRRLLVR